ncbi:MAG: right-handed parallel beta-helix repeat-containing protein [Thermoguttaceae bacterium]|nr:right-handed parallel beta-helix repeat-containing protein [Thermoguttaceae bacterium]
MENPVKTTNPNEDLLAVVASLSRGETLVLAPGVYEIKKPLTIDKTILLKGATGKYQDVQIVRRGGTALAVTGDAPRFENISFASSKRKLLSSLTGGKDPFEYKSCVAVLGGAATFIGCGARSEDQSGFSVRGEGVSAKLGRCVASECGVAGIFFDQGATGVVAECLFADNGHASVDCEGVPEGKRVEIRRSQLVRGGWTCLFVHDGGRVKVVDSEIVANGSGRGLGVDNGFLKLRSTKVRGLPKGEGQDKPTYGIQIGGGELDAESVEVSNCDFGVLVMTPEPTKIKLTRCSTVDCVMSVVPRPKTTELAMEDCDLNVPPRDYPEDSDESKPAPVKKKRKLSSKEHKAAVARYRAIMESELGPCLPLQVTSVFPEVGGIFFGYYFPDSKYEGTFVASQEYFDRDDICPANSTFNTFEIVMATRLPLPRSYRGEQRPESEGREFAERANDFSRAIMTLNGYSRDVRPVDRYESLGFSPDFGDAKLAGKRYIFDALGAPGEFGIIIAIEVFPQEIERATKVGVPQVIAELKQAGYWPYSDMNRPLLPSCRN